ncbi:MAG: hypothetical protein QM726_07705 [Chitinophagaceae bacterium]
MKVDNLLGPYLYQFKKLSLPGIGLFTLDEKAVLPDENAKVKMAIEGISFVPKTGPQLDDSLVLYIKEHTGKMKPLAEADLHSFIATAFQYLNIGKPFYFEGIGTLQKTKDNTYNFTPGTVIAKKDEITHKHIDTKRQTVDTDIDIDEPVSRKSSFNAGKLIIALAVILTLAAVGWGGYYLYNKNTADSDSVIVKTETSPAASTDSIANTATSNTIDSTGKKPDTINNTAKTDSTIAVKPAATAATTSIPVNGFKFVLETTEKKMRALKRFDQIKGSTMLKEYNNVAALETKDSVLFKIYTVVPCPVTDTAKVREQLNAWYYGTGVIKVKLEQ